MIHLPACMKTGWVMMVCLVFFATSAAGDTVRDLAAVMTDHKASWETRCAAQDALDKTPSQDALEVLLPFMEKDAPLGAIWNSVGRESDKKAPVKWQIYYALAQSWEHHVNSLPRDSAGSALLALLEKAVTANARVVILGNLAHHWVPEAEAPVAKLLEASPENAMVTTAAARLLIVHGNENYHHVFLGKARNGDLNGRKMWFDVLSDPRHKQRTGVDPEVVRMGFELLTKELAKTPEYVHSGYFLAIQIGNYIGQEFKPDQREAGYQGKDGLAENFFRDTAQNAAAWWAQNKDGIEERLSTPKASVP